MVLKARKPYLNLGQSVKERFSAKTRFLATSNRLESELEKPYNQLEYEAMHNDPIGGWNDSDYELINPPPFSDDPELPPVPDLPDIWVPPEIQPFPDLPPLPDPWVAPDPVELDPIPELPPPWTPPEGGMIDGDPPGYADGLLLPVINCMAAPLCEMMNACFGYLGGTIAEVRVVADEGAVIESSWSLSPEDGILMVEFLVDDSFSSHTVTVEVEDTEGNTASSTVDVVCGGGTGKGLVRDGEYTTEYSRTAETYYNGSTYTDTGETFGSTMQDSFSVVLDFKPDVGSNTYRNVLFGVSHTDIYYSSRITIRYDDGVFTIYYNISSGSSKYVRVISADLQAEMEDGSYHEVAVVLDNVDEEMRLYIDGVYIVDVYEATGLRYFDYFLLSMSSFNADQNAYIGVENYKGTNEYYHFFGYIKNVYVYSGQRYYGIVNP